MLVTRKKTGDIRFVVDFRELSKAVQRQTYQIPRLDDMLPLLTNAKLFSSLDGVLGYLQIPVHADSRELLTSSTPFGRYCFQRLLFGICSAPELYQMLVSQLLGDLSGQTCYQDDILVYAENEGEHDIRAVLDRLRSAQKQSKIFFVMARRNIYILLIHKAIKQKHLYYKNIISSL